MIGPHIRKDNFKSNRQDKNRRGKWKFMVLLQLHVLQLEVCDNWLKIGKEKVETICFKLLNNWWPNQECHSDEVVLTLKEATNKVDLVKEIGHFYMSSLVSPLKRIAFVQRSFTWKTIGKNVIYALLGLQNR